MSAYTQFKRIPNSSTTSKSPQSDRNQLQRSGSAQEEPGFFSRLFSLAPAAPVSARDAGSSQELPQARLPEAPEEDRLAARPWMPDKLVSRCHSCDSNFTAVRRRHHCRVCGLIFCNSCADNYLDRSYFGFADHEVIRVCNLCFQGRKQQLQVLRMGQDSPMSGMGRSPRISSPNAPRRGSHLSDGEYSDSPGDIGGFQPLVGPLGSSASTKLPPSAGVDTSFANGSGGEEDLDDQPQVSTSFWDEESVPSYPIDRRPSSIATISMALPNLSFSAASHNTLLRPQSHEHLQCIVESLLRRHEATTGLNEGIWVPVLTELAADATKRTQLSWERDVMDVTRYVRVKVVPGGSISASHYIPGLIVSKMVAHKAMSSRIEQPRVLLMGCAVEFSRPDWQFVGFDVLQVQERDFLRILVDRIMTKKPDVLISSDTVSSLALEFLKDAGITCVTRVKKTVMERLSRFTGASIVSYLSDISSAVVGTSCGLMHSECFMTPSGVRNVLIFDSCIEKNGGTILLRGEDTHNLHLLKKFLLFSVYATYHLRLEGAFVSDLSIHEMGRSGPSVNLMDLESDEEPSSISPGVVFAKPLPENSPVVTMEVRNDNKRPGQRASDIRSYPDLVAIHERAGGWSRSLESEFYQAMDMVQKAPEERSNFVPVAGAETDDILKNQSIVYSFTQHNAGKRSHCVTYQPHMIEFYSRNDMPLFLFLKWCRQSSICPVQACQRPLNEHETSILYSKYRLYISTSPNLPSGVGQPLENEVVSWFGCNECMEASEPKVLSHATLSMSLGKFLELVFLDRSLSCSVGHRLNPNGTLAFAFAGKLTSIAFLRSPVFSVSPPPLTQHRNADIESAVVERELTALAAAAHVTYGLVKRFVDGTPLEDTLEQEEGDFLQSINDAKHSRLLEINRLYRLLFTNVMRWQGLYDENGEKPGGSASGPTLEVVPSMSSMEYGSGSDSLLPPSGGGSGHSSSNSLQTLSPMERRGSMSRSGSGLDLASSATVSPSMRPAMLTETSVGTLTTSAAPGAPVDASVRRKIANVIKKQSPQLLTLQQQICEELLEFIGKEKGKSGVMHRLFSGHGAPMPLSPLTGEFMIVLDQEPSTHIACALGTDSYREQMHSMLGPMMRKHMSSSGSGQAALNSNTLDFETMSEDLLVKLAMRATQKDMKVSFESMLPKLQYQCDVTIYYPLQFAALRRLFCGGDRSFVCSMARSQSWEAKEEGGGGSRAEFVNTLDSLFLLKSVPSVELKNFQAFASKYFQYMMTAMRGDSPTLLVKIVGMFSIDTKNPSGQSIRQDFIVMERMFYDCNIARTFDLKGSVRNRLRPDGAVVLQDENLRRMMWSSPIVIDEVSKAKLALAIFKDTSFLSDVSVMDYSILVGIDESTGSVAVGIIDYIRPYSWDKMVEYVMKSTISTGGKTPTVISPADYSERFRQFTWNCFVLAPDRNALVLLAKEGGENAKEEEQVPVVVMGFEE